MQLGYFADIENMLYVGMVTSMFLLKGNQKHFIYWFTFLVFMSLKIYEFRFQNVEKEIIYILTLVNNFLVSFVIYFFLCIYHSNLITFFNISYQQEQTLRVLLDNVSVYMAMMDPEGKYIMVNQNYANNFDLNQEEAIGKYRKEVLPKDIYNKHEPMFQKALKGEIVSFLEETEFPNGVSISANGKYEPIRDSLGSVIAITLCVDDVSGIIKTQEELQTANETKDKLFSIIAHDIKNPLNLFQDLLNINNEITKNQFIEYQEVIKSRLSHLSETIDELLDWSRTQLGGIRTYPSKVNVYSLINEKRQFFDFLIIQKKIDFKIKCSPEIGVWIDENHFKIALRNIIHNSIKFTNESGFVLVKAIQEKEDILVSVIDSGIGMTPEQIDSVSKKEIQKSKSGTNKEMGTGLGLSLSFGFLEKNNCSISIISELGEGTEIRIRIPKNQAKQIY